MSFETGAAWKLFVTIWTGISSLKVRLDDGESLLNWILCRPGFKQCLFGFFRHSWVCWMRPLSCYCSIFFSSTYLPRQFEGRKSFFKITPWSDCKWKLRLIWTNRNLQEKGGGGGGGAKIKLNWRRYHASSHFLRSPWGFTIRRFILKHIAFLVCSMIWRAMWNCVLSANPGKHPIQQEKRHVVCNVGGQKPTFAEKLSSIPFTRMPQIVSKQTPSNRANKRHYI